MSLHPCLVCRQDIARLSIGFGAIDMILQLGDGDAHSGWHSVLHAGKTQNILDPGG